jgi:glycosyltransferase XagB
MADRDATRRGRALVVVAFGILLALAAVTPVGASGDGEPPPADGPAGGTVLPPADEDSVSIVPTDERPDEPAEQPSGATDLDQTGGFDLGDVSPLVAVGWLLVALLSLIATVIAATRLTRTLHVWRSPAAVRASGFGRVTEPATSFSLLVPARRGEAGLGRTLDRLGGLDHPSSEVLAVVGRDDLENRAAALAAAARSPGRVRVVVVDDEVGTRRAAALDRAVAECHGAVIGVFGPGDEVRRPLLRRVDSCFAEDRPDAVQGGVLVVGRHWRWFTTRHVVDRYFWHRSRLQYHAQQHFTPLEETTVFVRAPVLRAAGGWHRQSVAEGCDLGVRLSVNGAKVVARYDPSLVTHKGAPDRTGTLLREETRRIRGFLQVLRSGVWRRLPTRRQRRLARVTLLRPFAEALTGLAITTAAVVAVVGGAPAPFAVLALVPAVPALLTLGVELTGLADLRQLHDQRVLRRDRLQLVLSVVPYQLLQALAALLAMVGELGTVGRRKVAIPAVPDAPPPLAPMGPANRDGIIDLGDRREPHADRVPR